MISPMPNPSTAASIRWFYSLASLSLLVLMLIGFQLFYLQGKAFPGRPLTPPIRTLILIHGSLMTAWMFLAVAQPLLVGAGHKRLHMKLGILGVALAVGMVVVGVWLGIESARVSPPELRVFGLAPKEFMAITVLSILLFGLFVAIGVVYRRRPDVHRPMMLLASVAIIGAATGRMERLNALYAGTMWETLFRAFFVQVIVGAILFIVKCLLSKSFDRWFAAGFVLLTVGSAAIALGAKTQAWSQASNFLLGSVPVQATLNSQFKGNAVLRLDAKPEAITFDTAKTAVIVVDMQNDFGSKGGMFERAGIDISGIQKAVEPSAKVLAAARKAGLKVIYLKMGYKPDLSDLGAPDSVNRARHLQLGVGNKVNAPDGKESRILIRETWNTDILTELKQGTGDDVIYKTRFSGFYETDLDARLKKMDARHLIFVGCTTSICVDSTVRDAMFRDYNCVLLSDCMSEPIGIGLPRTNHDASLLTAEVLLGWVSDSARFLKALQP